MRVGHLQVSRPPYYDRNPLVTHNTYEATLAPPQVVERWSYTCPSNRRSWVEQLSAKIQRATAAAPAARADSTITFIPNGGSPVDWIMGLLFTNVVGDGEQVNLAAIGALNAGDVVKYFTADTGSVGGSVEFMGVGRFMEFTL